MHFPFFRKKGQIDASALPRTAAPSTVIRKAAKGYKGPSSLRRIGMNMSYMGLSKERNSFIQNLAMMLGAGLHVTDALDTLTHEARKGPMKKIVRKMQQEVENGEALWRAMDKQAFFTPYTIALIRIGEESGNLSQNLANLSDQNEKDESMKQKVKMAMVYPIIVISLTGIIAIGLSWFVLPQLVGVLYALNVELPKMTILVITVADFFTTYGSRVVPASFFGLTILAVLMKYTSMRHIGQWMVLHIPGVKTLIIQASIARFGIILGSLLRAGVPPVEALQSLTNVTDMLRYKHFYQKLAEHIQVGDSFSKSFTILRGSKKVLPLSVQQIIVTGERSGRLSEVLLKIAEIYQRKAEETAQKLPVILEPILLIFVAGLVAVIAFSIIMPIYSVVGNIGG